MAIRPAVAGAGLAAALLAAFAPPPAAGRDRPAVGVLLWHDSPNDRETLAGIREALAAGRLDPAIEVLEARGDDAAARRALREFDARPVGAVVALGTGAALRARDEVRRVPVIFAAVTDPVGSGVVGGEAGSGRNLCGVASGIDPAEALRVFRAALPGLRTLAVVHDPANPVSSREVEVLGRAGAALEPALRLVVRPVAAADLVPEGALRAAVAEALRGAEALWIPIDLAVYGRAGEAAEAAAAARRPVLATAAPAARTAAAVCVTADFRAVGRLAAVRLARVLRGADPGTIPLARPRSSFEVPLSLLAAADEFAGVAGGR
jgi:putative ABC transport system substrate-binding protein